MAKATTENKCQSIYWCLFDILEKERKESLSPATYIREWEQTARCDHFTDLKDVRLAIRDHLDNNLGENAVKHEVHSRILKFEETPQDVARALQTMSHYQEWHSKCLFGALNFNHKVYYYTWYTAGKTAVALGLAGTIGGGVLSAARFMKTLQQQQAQILQQIKAPLQSKSVYGTKE
jgi:hypothetical protein